MPMLEFFFPGSLYFLVGSFCLVQIFYIFYSIMLNYGGSVPCDALNHANPDHYMIDSFEMF